MLPAVSREAYEAARHQATVLDRPDRGRIVVSGADRASYLQGLLTNDMAALAPGTGCYAAYLTPQGRMIADLWVYELGDSILLSVPRDVKDAVLGKLDQFVFSEDVQLGDATEAFAATAVVGPRAAGMVAAVLDGPPDDRVAALPEHGNLRAQLGGEPAIVIRVTDTGEPGYELLVDASRVDVLRAALRARGAAALDPAAAEALRIEAGVPVFRRDMDEETIPLEAGIEARALSFTKGCYVGQEVIARVLHRGHGRVARRLVGLTLDGECVPPVGVGVQADGRDVGRVTSSTWSPALGRPIALAYVHRDFVDPGTGIVVEGSAGQVTALPFVARA